MWHEQETSTIKAMGEHITIGHDLWYKKAPATKWTKIQGNITSLNMAGWGDIMDRVNLWKQMATSKSMIVAIIDHKRTNEQKNDDSKSAYKSNFDWIELQGQGHWISEMQL